MRDYLVTLRKERNESQQDVANAINVSRQYYSLIENGERQKKMDTTIVFTLASHFGISAADLLEMEQAYSSSTSI